MVPLAARTVAGMDTALAAFSLQSLPMGTGQLGRAMLVLGLVLTFTGLVLLAASALGLGRLPGDVSFGRGATRVHVLLATSLIVSVVATVALNLLLRR
jgi:uncharacterized membrane protein YidH (DUF202 family)